MASRIGVVVPHPQALAVVVKQRVAVVAERRADGGGERHQREAEQVGGLAHARKLGIEAGDHFVDAGGVLMIQLGTVLNCIIFCILVPGYVT